MGTELLNIRVIPNAKREKVEKIDKTTLKIWTHTPPENDKANKRVKEILADYFGVRKSSVTMIRGATSRNKVFKIII